MTIDKSLRVKAGAISNRNVLTRAERVLKLKESRRWKEGDSVLGLPKVRVLKLALKKKKKAAKAEEGAEGAAAAGCRWCGKGWCRSQSRRCPSQGRCQEVVFPVARAPTRSGGRCPAKHGQLKASRST